MEEITNKLEEYKANLANLFVRSRLWLSDTEEEKQRIRSVMELPFESLSFYRYYKLDDKGYVLSDLRNARLTITSPRMFNDPYDSLLYVNKDWVLSTLDRESMEKMCGIVKRVQAGEKIEDVAPDLNAINAEVLSRLTKLDSEQLETILLDDNFAHNAMRGNMSVIDLLKQHNRVACFSETNVSPLLWAHYADCGKGICVEYEIPKVAAGSVFPESLISFKERKIFISFLPILYSNERYDATHIVSEYNEQLLIIMMGRQNDYPKLTSSHDLLSAEKAAVYKSKDWEYEREWRLIFYPFTLMDPDRISVRSPVVKSVILGNAMLDSQIEQVLDALRTRKGKIKEDIEIKRLVLDTDSKDYSLTTVPLKM